MADSVFSLDLSEQFTRVAHLALVNNKIELYSLGYDNTIQNFYTNPTDRSAQDQAQVVTSLHSQLKIPATHAHVVIPDTMSYSQLLLMPNLTEEELVKSIRLQADEFIPLPINEVYIDLEIITKLPNEKLLIIFIAAQKRYVDHIYNTLSYANIEPVSLENELSALGRFLTEVYRSIKVPTMVVNFGFTGSSIYVVNPAFPYFQITRTSRIGFDIILRDLKVNTNLNQQKAMEALQSIGLGKNASMNVYAIIYPVLNELFSEMEKTVLLAKEKYGLAIQNVYLFNYDTHIANLHETIQTKMSLPTQSLPLSSILVPNTITQSFSHIISSFIPVITAHIR